MRVLRAVAALAVVSGTVLAVPATAHADDVRARQWYLTTLRLAEAHKEVTGKGVTIGLVDSGIDPSHQDISEAVVEGQVFGGDTGTGNGNQGGNGTANAAILAGHGHGDNEGVLGVAPEAEIVSADIAGGGQNKTELIADAIAFLTKRDVDVIAVSLSVADNEKLRIVTQQAAKKGIPVVAAAGDAGTGAPGFPVGAKGTVNVVGSDKDGQAVPGEVTTPGEDEALTLAAPAQDLPMATTGNDYPIGSDPSFATQIVAGTMALVKEKQPDLKGEALIATVRDTASGKGKFDSELGYGVVAPKQAIQATAATSSDTSAGGVLGNGNTVLALVIQLVGILGLSALVLFVRIRDRSRRLALAAPGVPGMSHTGTMPRISTAPPVASGDTGTMPRISDTGTFPRISTAPPVASGDTPPGGTPTPQTPPYGQKPPGR